jgi:hypothetical protein
METGVWRGGMSALMRGVILANAQGHRASFVCDSFSGLPSSAYKQDIPVNWNATPYLEQSVGNVKRTFESLGLVDTNIFFVKGFFANTMTPLRVFTKDSKFSLLRLDGDMYESTVDVLYNFYDKLSVGGYVIIDDYKSNFPARWATDDFHKVHQMTEQVIWIDTLAAYWQKTKEVDVQHWRYRDKKFK